MLDEGRVVEQGTHAELIAAGGRYWSLLRRQQLEEAIERRPTAVGRPATGGASNGMTPDVDRLAMQPVDSTHDAPSTDVALLEAALNEATQVEIAELQARDALKTQFLANISHDLRTPLDGVITHAEILRDGILGR